MIRVPAAIVGITLALVLAAAVSLLARLLGRADLTAALLPACAAAGGYIAGRWAVGQPLAPGLSVGIIGIAARMGLSLGLDLGLLALVNPAFALFEVLAAMSGGLLGAHVARRAAQPRPARPEYV